MDEEIRQRINALLTAVAEGDDAALCELYETIGGRMLSVAFGILRERGAAEDALQESFCRIVKKAKTFRYRQNGYGWCCTIVRNTALNMLKAQRRRRETSLETFYALPCPHSETETSETRILVEQAMLRLPPQERRALYLKYYCDLPVRQIAGEMHLSKSAAQRLIQSGESALRQILSQGGTNHNGGLL